MVKMFFALPLEFEPGETWAYDNTGFILLGFIIEKASGKTYWDFLDERLFRPAGMTATRSTAVESLVPNRAAGYRLLKGELKNQEWVAPMVNTTADGSLYFSILDLAKWDAALYTEKLLKKSTMDQMWTPVKLNNGQTHAYGFGWFLDPYQGRPRMWHTGSTMGFRTAIERFTEGHGLSIIILGNRTDLEPEKLALQVADLIFKEQHLRP